MKILSIKSWLHIPSLLGKKEETYIIEIHYLATKEEYQEYMKQKEKLIKND